MLRHYFVSSIVLTTLFSIASLFSSCGGGQGNEQSGNEKAVSTKPTEKKTDDQAAKKILFFGTSLTAGYGLDVTEAFPALIQHKIDSLKLPYKVVNAGLSGETSAAGKTRIDWLLKQPFDIIVLELGANDGLRGLPLTETKDNLQQITDKVKKKYPQVRFVLAGMQIPPSMGAEYAQEFKSIFPELARKNNMVLVPFLLQGVGGVPKLNQKDGIHPTVEGQKILAENVWAQLKGLL
ncbi:arylesterase [Pedobacter sp. FW305-3-2-15-E-R2A2]|uniref:arylesterase n=1 Tax=Pedobacter sp. FW305-3-2-15-E-R2A2 TaxID=3140251 RepID=UPI003140B880